MPTKRVTEGEAAALPEAEAAPEETAPACSNCGQPAVYRTTGQAANVDYYCQSCADVTYPQPWPEKRTPIDAGPPLEALDA